MRKFFLLLFTIFMLFVAILGIYLMIRGFASPGECKDVFYSLAYFAS